DVAAAPDELLVPVGLGPGRLDIAAHDRGIDVPERPADRLRERKVGFPVAGIVVIVEDAADAARLLAVGQVEVLVAPISVALVVDAGPVLASRAHRGVEVDAVWIVLRTAAVEHGRQVAATAEPPL